MHLLLEQQTSHPPLHAVLAESLPHLVWKLMSRAWCCNVHSYNYAFVLCIVKTALHWSWMLIVVSTATLHSDVAGPPSPNKPNTCPSEHTTTGMYHDSSLVPRPHPAFRHLHYGKAGRAWYLFSCEHDVIKICRTGCVSHMIQCCNVQIECVLVLLSLLSLFYRLKTNTLSSCIVIKLLTITIQVYDTYIVYKCV